MKSYYAGRQLGKLLVEEGVLPEQWAIADVELLVPIDGALKLRCDVLVTDEQLAGLQRAIGRLITPPEDGQ